jgi:hypothetical protein
LEIAFLSTQSTSGAPVRLDEGPVRFTVKSKKPGMIAGAVIVSLLFLLRTGGDVTLQAGSTFVASGDIRPGRRRYSKRRRADRAFVSTMLRREDQGSGWAGWI